MTGEDIERYGYRTLAEALMAVPGFYISDDRNYSYVGVRGFGRPTDYNNRILLLLNGNPLNEGIFGAAQIETSFGLNLEDVARIEIVRGPGSTMYGTGAMLAVINVITMTGKDSPGLRLSAEAGSYGRLGGSAAYGLHSARGLDLFLSGRWTDIKGQDLYFREFDAPETNNGLAQDLDRDNSTGLFGSLKYRNFSAQAYVSRRKKAIPTASWGTDFNARDTWSLDAQRFLELKYRLELNPRFQLQARAYTFGNDYREMYPYDGILDRDRADENALGSELEGFWDISSKNRVTFGLEYQNHFNASYKYSSPEADIFHGDFPYRRYSLYAQEEFSFNQNLILTAGIRYDRHSRFGGFAVPRLALVYHLSRASTLKLLYGDAYRSPNIYEANYEEGAGEGEYGQKLNPLLTSERISTLEAVFEHRLSSNIWWTVSLYSFRMRDLIELTLDPVDELWFYGNVASVRARGAEVSLTGRFKNGIQAFVSANYQNAVDRDTGLGLTNSPATMLKSGISLPLFRGVHLGLQNFYESGRRTVYGTRTKPFLLTDLNLASRQLFGHLELSLKLGNLFDLSYAYPGGYEHLQPEIFQNGRNFIVRAEYRF